VSALVKQCRSNHRSQQEGRTSVRRPHLPFGNAPVTTCLFSGVHRPCLRRDLDDFCPVNILLRYEIVIAIEINIRRSVPTNDCCVSLKCELLLLCPALTNPQSWTSSHAFSSNSRQGSSSPNNDPDFSHFLAFVSAVLVSAGSLKIFCRSHIPN
jgi:hypothetical protein